MYCDLPTDTHLTTTKDKTTKKRLCMVDEGEREINSKFGMYVDHCYTFIIENAMTRLD
jgi:hypothetical protein